MSEVWRPRRKHRRTPYYKVQVFTDVLRIWKDERGGFDTEAEAGNYIRDKLADRQARIIIVEEKGRRPLKQD